MIRVLKYSLIIVVALTIVIACDKVDDPYADVQTTGSGPSGPTEFDDTIYNDTTQTIRRVLLEEFTGHKCPNCPQGTAIANTIRSNNPDEVVLVAIHNSGSFSDPDPPDYPSNFETETGENLRVAYQVGAFPAGLLSRVEIGGSAKVAWQTWENEVTTLLADPTFTEPFFKVKLENIYNHESAVLRVRPTIETLKAVTGEVYAVAYLVESNIIAPQLDVTTKVSDYVHNHVLRDGFPANGAGKLIFTDPAIGDKFLLASEADEITYTLDTNNWVVNNMELIFFLFEQNNGEILHVEEVHVSEH